jgi:hypothetical protein
LGDGLHAACASGRKNGCPPALTARNLIATKELLADPAFTGEEVARQLRVASSMLYRHRA